MKNMFLFFLLLAGVQRVFCISGIRSIRYGLSFHASNVSHTIRLFHNIKKNQSRLKREILIEEVNNMNAKLNGNMLESKLLDERGVYAHISFMNRVKSSNNMEKTTYYYKIKEIDNLNSKILEPKPLSGRIIEALLNNILGNP